MLKPRWLATYGPIIKPEYFESKDEHELAEVLLEYWRQYKRPPVDQDDVLDLIGEDEYADIIGTVFLGVHDWDLEYASDSAIQFCKEQASKLAVLESLDDINKGDLSSVHSRLKEAMKVGEDIGDVGIDIKKDASKWLHEQQMDKVPTGLIHLDIAMEGGLGAGELGVFMSPPNYGKSMSLINVGYGAAGPISRCNVIHFTLEMSANVVAKRYAARMLFRFPPKSGSMTEYEDDFIRVANMLMPGSVRTLGVRGTVANLRSKTDMYIDRGFTPDLIVVDYADEIQPSRRRESHWIEIGDVFRELRDMAFDYNVPIWTGTQANRGALNKEVITMGDLADSFQKASIADAIIAICQTAEEEKINQCRLYLAKLRDGKSRAMVRAKFYPEQQAIVTTGFA